MAITDNADRIKDPRAEKDGQILQHLKGKLIRWIDARKPFEAEWEQDYRALMCEYQKELKDGEGVDWRSQLYMPITKNKIVAAVSHIVGITLQGGKMPFDILSSPLPDSENNRSLDLIGFDLKERTQRMKRQLEDQLLESRAEDEYFDSLMTGATYGSACVKCPVEEMKSRISYDARMTKTITLPPMGEGGMAPEVMAGVQAQVAEAVEFREKITKKSVPAMRNLDIWDTVVDPECNGDAQQGDGVFHVSRLSPAEFAAWKDLKGPNGKALYNTEAVKAVMRQLIVAADDGQEGVPSTISAVVVARGPHRDQRSHVRNEIAVYEFAGKIRKKYFDPEAVEKNGEDGGEFVEVIVTFTEEYVLRAIENPYPGKLRPYHLAQWERLPGSAYGRGIARSLRDSQSMVNGLIRAYVDNKSLSSNLMFAIDEQRLAPGQDTTVRSGKIWRVAPGVDPNTVIQSITVPDVTGGILDGVRFGMSIADDSSGVPRIMEGAEKPGGETAFSASARLASASQQLGLVIRYWDQRIIEPVARALYYWNMMFNDDFSIKGDFDIVATGFNSFQSREVKLRALKEFVGSVAQWPNGAAYINTEQLFKLYGDFLDVDPSQILRPAAEVQAELAQQPPSDEQVKAQAQVQLAQLQGQIQAQVMQLQGQIDAQKIQLEQQFLSQREVQRAQIKAIEAGKEREVKLLQDVMADESKTKNQTLRIQGQMESMKIKTQSELLKIQAKGQVDMQKALLTTPDPEQQSAMPLGPGPVAEAQGLG